MTVLENYSMSKYKRAAVSTSHAAAPLLTLVLLVAVAASLRSRQPVEATDYFHRVRVASRQMPLIIGDWYGTEVPVAAPAIKILKPNFLISRRYQHLRTNRTVQLLVIQSLDPYDMVYHYPPNCFRHNGWTLQWSQERQWTTGQTTIPAMEYAFHRVRFTNDENVIVLNFVILATGLALDMTAIEHAARNPEERPFGAAQVQVVFDSTYTQEERQAIFDEIIQQLLPLIGEMVRKHSQESSPGHITASR